MAENTIDCIFDINGKYVVLVKRGNEPFKDYWALPGGRQNLGEKLEETVVREVQEETGLEIKLRSKQLPTPVTVLGEDTHLDQVRTYESGKDPRGGNTTVYAVKLGLSPEQVEKALKNGDDAKEIGVFKLNYLPELAFDHRQFLEDYFKKLKKYNNPIPTTDIVIEYDGGVVLVERKNPPYGLALPGGFAELGISLEQNAVKEAKEETGLNVDLKRLLQVYSDPSRDPRVHTISVAYVGKGWGKLEAGDDAKKANVYSIPEIKELIADDKLAFDHAKILERYLIEKGHIR
jgi:ADP-ribose pyrophosphatase YjhB (NUDIX family)